MSLLNPSGASNLKYSPSYPSDFHMPMCYTNCFKSKGLFMHPSCITFNFYFYFHFYPHLLSSAFSLCSSHLPISLVAFVSLFLSLFLSSLHHVPLLCTRPRTGKQKKPSMLECVCCRSGADCTMVGLSL